MLHKNLCWQCLDYASFGSFTVFVLAYIVLLHMQPLYSVVFFLWTVCMRLARKLYSLERTWRFFIIVVAEYLS